jgi:hypothetical protein
MIPMGNDQVKVEDGGHIAKDKITIRILQTLLLGVEVLGAKKAGSLQD